MIRLPRSGPFRTAKFRAARTTSPSPTHTPVPHCGAGHCQGNPWPRAPAQVGKQAKPPGSSPGACEFDSRPGHVPYKNPEEKRAADRRWAAAHKKPKPERKVTEGWLHLEGAACSNCPPNDAAMFTGSFPTRVIARELAHRYCHHCPVMDQCFNWAMDERYFSGIAGGTMFSSGKERAGRRQIIKIPRRYEE